jgi:acyl phosphate:glycerol-3-phosphate acyltransferase
MATLLLAVSYLLGSVSFSILVVRIIAHKDIREEGSGNAGATNVLRNYGPLAGIAVAILDIGKGAAAVFLMRTVTANPVFLAGAAFAVILGHVFPAYFRFRGGKGVATTVGAFLALAWAPALVAAGIFVLVIAFTRYVSLGSILSMVALPPVSILLFRVPDAIVLAECAVAFLVVFKHLENLKRLASGTERKLGSK